jgi:hypothetical protein
MGLVLRRTEQPSRKKSRIPLRTTHYTRHKAYNTQLLYMKFADIPDAWFININFL